ncbi:MAG: hypothetical protein RL139_1119 [Gemmatimonadota bacterium]|jgi:hypothetical protein
MTNRTNDPAGVDDLVRSAGDRGRVTFDAPTASADVPAEDLTPAPIDLDDDGPNHCPGCQPCKRHKQAVAFCDQDCPTVVRLQAAEDGENAHYWNGTAG